MRQAQNRFLCHTVTKAKMKTSRADRAAVRGNDAITAARDPHVDAVQDGLRHLHDGRAHQVRPLPHEALAARRTRRKRETSAW